MNHPMRFPRSIETHRKSLFNCDFAELMLPDTIKVEEAGPSYTVSGENGQANWKRIGGDRPPPVKEEATS